jgi:hypothetical protein
VPGAAKGVPCRFVEQGADAEEEEQRKLRAALSAVGHSTVVDACFKLHEANEAHKQRLGELEQAVAARGGEVERDLRAWMRDELATYPRSSAKVVATMKDASTQLDRMLSLQPVELHREASYLFAVSSHEPEADVWRNSDDSYKSPHLAGEEPISFWNFRTTNIDVLWINYDGDDARFPSSTVSACGAAVSRLLRTVLIAASAGQARRHGVFHHAPAPRMAHLRRRQR